MTRTKCSLCRYNASDVLVGMLSRYGSGWFMLECCTNCLIDNMNILMVEPSTKNNS